MCVFCSNLFAATPLSIGFDMNDNYLIEQIVVVYFQRHLENDHGKCSTVRFEIWYCICIRTNTVFGKIKWVAFFLLWLSLLAILGR